MFDNFQTKEPSIYAVGDVTGSVALTLQALAEGMALAKYLFADEPDAVIDYDLIPTTILVSLISELLVYQKKRSYQKGTTQNLCESI